MNETIKELPESERPYEKCIREGAGALSDGELLAVILRSGTRGSNSVALANEILNYMKASSYPGLPGLLHSSVKDLMKIHGIGEVKAIQLKCIGELSKRIAAASARPQLCFENPATIAQYYMEQLRHEEQELMVCMMLDGRNHLLGEQVITRGTANATLITPREVYMEALRHHALNLILVHNHPGGDPTPSGADTDVTMRMYRAGELLGIQLLDHVIIGDHRYVSFREQGFFKQFAV
ncbi:MAG: DNA repair protein RadC [Eubacteriales bacterium]|nr:DNA repair protein RadC [Eubacteriales bacterium]